MPCYNAELYISEAIESVLAQDYEDVELIIVDDGSSDRSLQITSKYSGRGITIISTDNKGAAAARNRAFALSSGDYVIFMDADDIVSPAHVSALMSRAEGPHDIIMGQWDRFYRNKNEAQFPWRLTYADASGPEWLISGGWNMMQCAMFLLPRAHIEKFGCWNEARSPVDDFEFYCRMIANSNSLRFTDGAKVFYRSAVPNSLSSRKSREYAEGQLASLLSGTKHVLSVFDTSKAKAACAEVLQHFEYTHFPDFPDLRASARARVAELGGAISAPDGPPGFHALRRFVGWRLARRIQRFAEANGLNGAARQSQ